MKTCRSCGASVPDTAKFCGQCGKDMNAPVKETCRVCGSEMGPNDKFCMACGFGKPMDASSAPSYHSDTSQLIPPAKEPTKVQAPPSAPVPLENRYEQPSSQLYAPQQPMTGTKCLKCGGTNPPGLARCKFCNSEGMGRKLRTYANAAGNTMIITGAINLFLFGITAIDCLLTDIQLTTTVVIWILTLTNVFVIWAGFQAKKLKRFDLCFVASVVSMLSLVFFLAPLAILFLALSKVAFRHGGQSGTF